MRGSRERVGSLNSLVHSRALRFGFPVCMRACPSVRPFVFAFVTRARSYADASLAPTMRRRGPSARRKKKKERKRKEGNRAREAASCGGECEKRAEGKKKKERREDKRVNAEARKRKRHRPCRLAYIKAKVIIKRPCLSSYLPFSPSVFSFDRSLRLARCFAMGEPKEREKEGAREGKRERRPSGATHRSVTMAFHAGSTNQTTD